MNIEPTANYEITGLEIYFSIDNEDKLKNTALKLADGWTYDLINYALIYTPTELVTGTGVDIKASLYKFQNSSKVLSLLEKLNYRGCGIRVAPDTVFVEMITDII